MFVAPAASSTACTVWNAAPKFSVDAVSPRYSTLGTSTRAAVATTTRPVPVLLTRVELEIEPLVPGQRDFLAAAAGAGVPVEVQEVSGARHGFETLDDTDAARAAIRTAVDRITTLLG